MTGEAVQFRSLDNVQIHGRCINEAIQLISSVKVGILS
jgi:hypothetical protein